MNTMKTTFTITYNWTPKGFKTPFPNEIFYIPATSSAAANNLFNHFKPKDCGFSVVSVLANSRA